MHPDFLAALKKYLTTQAIPFRNGVAGPVIERAQTRCAAAFPPDLIFLLSNLVIDDGRFIDWETISDALLQSSLRGPYEGLCYDIEHNGLWLDDWGKKPDERDDRIAVFTRIHASHAPILIPVLGHRYLPSQPCEAGNPVYSVHQSDIIVYGRNLEEYLANEYGMKDFGIDGTPKTIPFWGTLVS